MRPYNSLEEDDKQPSFKLIDKMLTTKVQRLFAKNVATQR
jgi:hypothetical protein